MSAMELWLGQIKIPVFRVTRPYLNLLMKPRIIFRFSGQKYNFMHFERLFKMPKIIFFQEKIRKYVRLSYLLITESWFSSCDHFVVLST